MKKHLQVIKTAFPHTIPVLTGFSFLGIAYGILMNSKGYGISWIFLMSFIAFAGSAQYVAIFFLTSVFNPIYALLVTLMVNARHVFYGLSFLDKYENTGRLKPYLIFGLCDETFSILCAIDPPESVDRKWFYFYVTLLDHSYWVMGSVIGGLIGNMLLINTKGLDFVLTALFIVIFVSQWKKANNRKPALIGIISSVLCLYIFGPEQFILPSMLVILITLSMTKKESAL
jgi:4-azaleucine resistance transporter AzlC